jgi:hypothetical protein
VNHTRPQTGIRYIVYMTLAVTVVLTLTGLVLGQSRPRSRTPRDAEAAARERQRQVQNRSMAMQHIGNDEKKKRENAELFNRIREDFMRIQVVNNDMLKAISRDETLDYKLISDATEEINKLAKRLRTNLAVPEVEKDDERQNKTAPTVEEMKASLLKLDDSIMSFVTSLGVVNTQDVNKVGRDLTDVIEISNNIRRDAEKLNKAQASR